MCCSSCISLNSVQSFVIENCNGPTIENGLNNVCLHPLSRTFTVSVHQQFDNFVKVTYTGTACIVQGVPDCLKMAEVISIYKKEDFNETTNCRQISILSLYCNIKFLKH